MKKQQFILLSGGFILLIVLYFFGNTTAPVSATTSSVNSDKANSGITTTEVLNAGKKNITAQQSAYLTQLENSVVRGNVKEQQIRIYRQLAAYWQDTLHQQTIAAYYFGEEAKLENSEKNLNFAARLLLVHLMAEDNPAMQNWLATNAKVLFEKSLQINPANDSVRIELGACYIFGNISNTPMEGILKIKQVADKDPGNMYAQLILGLGDIKSGQYDKAAERLQLVTEKEPNNLQAVFNLAETYERKGDKANAVAWYRKAQNIVSLPEAKREIEEKIRTLQ
ncbi:MAG TPA: tetratricopeptide repeat protein [Chitinophagaceae bacterium]|nr:tetratricopeptide repeat protein [Chitinophagaceae bacterium]